jgi:hypothetical protein
MFVAATGLFARDAAAALAPMLHSSYYEGSVIYDEGSLYGRIDFAVYDTTHPLYGSEYQDNGLGTFTHTRYLTTTPRARRLSLILPYWAPTERQSTLPVSVRNRTRRRA